ncbi:MAG TPA: ATP-binding protein [Solirubrobacterales bacterium]|nr:ATP-binding protein [Solirubrobacterales bacterium]
MIDRRAHELVVEAAEDSRVVLVVGPRQAGKTTLVRDLADGSLPRSYVTMDAASVRRAAAEDPVGFIAGLDLPVAIDEIQRAPDLLLEVKRIVDQDPRPGQFLLTGSARVLSLPRVADALVGRVESVTLWPISQAEVEESKSNLVDALFAAEPPSISGAKEGPDAWLTRALAGGLPEAREREEGRRRDAWFSSYLETLVERDIRDLSEIRAVDEVPALLALLASRVTGPLNIAALAADLRISEASARRYLALLRAVFALLRVPAWRRNLGRRATAAPKFQLVDSGLGAHLLSLDRERLAADESLTGGLFEGFARMELVKQAEWSKARPGVFHFRTRGGAREVDAVLERRGGKVVGVEMKASASLSRRDFRGLETLREERGDAFVAGVVIHAGEQTLPFGDRLWALPVSALWR